MIADVVSAAVIGMNLYRGAVSIGGVWRMTDPFAKHLSVVAFHILLQNFLLSACHSG